jgi:hypothetical protein
MVRRPDLVLAAIPVLVLGGLLAEWVVPIVVSAVGVGDSLTALPLWVGGVLGAAVVTAYGLARLPAR